MSSLSFRWLRSTGIEIVIINQVCNWILSYSYLVDFIHSSLGLYLFKIGY